MPEALKDSQLAKQRDIDLLRRRYTPEVRKELSSIDYRLAEYFDDLTTNVSVVFDVDPVLAAQLKDAKFQFVAKPTAEGEQDATDDNTQTGDNGAGNNNPPSGELEG